MTAYKRGLDAATILTPYAKKIAAAGFTSVGRYLKSLTKAEVAALHDAGLGLWLIFESTADRALAGRQAGNDDGVKAAAQVAALGLPGDLAIFAAVDTDVQSSQLSIVSDYIAAFDAAIGKHPLGVYACGAVLSHLPGIEAPWLAGAMGWSGSRAYDLTAAWAMKQGPTIQANHVVLWAGESWPALPFDYDPNLIAADVDAVHMPPPLPTIAIPSARDLQAALASQGNDPGPIDGIWGPRSAAALLAYYNGE